MAADESSLLPKDRIVRVTFDIALPCSASPEQIEEWVLFELASGSLADANPLSSHELEAFGHRVTLTDTGLRGIVQKVPIEGEGNAYRLRYIREPVTPESRAATTPTTAIGHGPDLKQWLIAFLNYARSHTEYLWIVWFLVMIAATGVNIMILSKMQESFFHFLSNQ